MSHLLSRRLEWAGLCFTDWIVLQNLTEVSTVSVSNFFFLSRAPKAPCSFRVHVEYNQLFCYKDCWASQPEMGEASFHLNFVTHFGLVTFAILQSFIRTLLEVVNREPCQTSPSKNEN